MLLRMSEVTTPPPRRSRAADPSMRAHRWAKDGRSKEAQLYRAVVRQLRQHVGGKPSHAEALLIGRIAWVQVHLAHIDTRAMQDGGLSPHATREYLAWANSLAKLLGRLGMQPAAARPLTLAEIFASRAAQEAADDAPAPRRAPQHPAQPSAAGGRSGDAYEGDE